MCSIWCLVLNKHLYLSGVWLGVNLRLYTKNRHVSNMWQEDWITWSEFANHSRFNDEHVNWKKKLIINKKDVTLLNSLATFHGTWYWTRKNLLSFQDPPIMGSTQASHTLDFLKNTCNSSIFFQSQPLSLGRDHCLAVVMMIYVHFDND